MSFRFIFLSVILSLLAGLAAADAIDEYIETTLSKQKIPGLALAIVRNGDVVKSKGYGYANLEHRVPVIPETIFQSGSVGKQFTAAAILLLVQEGKLALDDPILRFFDRVSPSWRKITVRHLLTHTSGIPDYTEKQVDFRRDHTEEDLLKILLPMKLEFQPGARWSYSNSGYMLLGFIIRKVTGKFYGDFLEERVFDPLGMNATRVISEADIISDRAAGYRLDDNGDWKNQDWVAPSLNTTADGALYFNVVDLVRWDGALNGEQLLAKTSKELWWSPVVLSSGVPYPYGFGWAIAYQRGYRVIQHGGHWQGFSTAICRYPENGISVMVLANLSGVDAVSIAHSAAGLYEPALKTSRFLEPQTGGDPSLTERMKKVLAEFASGAQTDSFGGGLIEVSEKEDREQAAEILKNMKSFDLLDCDNVSDRAVEAFGEKVSRFCYYKISTNEKTHYATFGLTEKNRVVSLTLEEH